MFKHIRNTTVSRFVLVFFTLVLVWPCPTSAVEKPPARTVALTCYTQYPKGGWTPLKEANQGTKVFEDTILSYASAGVPEIKCKATIHGNTAFSGQVWLEFYRSDSQGEQLGGTTPKQSLKLTVNTSKTVELKISKTFWPPPPIWSGSARVVFQVSDSERQKPISTITRHYKVEFYDSN